MWLLRLVFSLSRTPDNNNNNNNMGGLQFFFERTKKNFRFLCLYFVTSFFGERREEMFVSANGAPPRSLREWRREQREEKKAKAAAKERRRQEHFAKDPEAKRKYEGDRARKKNKHNLPRKIWANKQTHEHYLYQMFERLDRDIERLVVSRDEEEKEKRVKYVADWLAALAKVPMENYLPAGLYLRDSRPIPEDLKTRVDLNAFYGDKLITSVLLDKIRKADGKYGAKQAPRNKMEANNFLSACIRNKTFAELAPDILPDVKITAEEWRHHEHVAGTAVEAAITCVADLSNETLRQAEKDIAIDAVANLILEQGLRYATSDVKPARAKFNDLLCLYSVKLVSKSVSGLVHDPRFIGTAKVTHRRVYHGDQRKRYKNVPLEIGPIEVNTEGTSGDNAKEAASVQILDLMKELGLVDEEYKAQYITDFEPVAKMWSEHFQNFLTNKKKAKKKKEDDEAKGDSDAREKQRRKMET